MSRDSGSSRVGQQDQEVDGENNGVMRETPPAFPFPDEEIVFSSAYSDFALGEDSWFCISKLPETQTHRFNGREHSNPYRLTIHTPIRGSTSFLVNMADAQVLIRAGLSLLAHTDRYGNEESGEHTVNLDYYNRRIPDEYEVRPKDAE